jgi:hypothetical protein
MYHIFRLPAKRVSKFFFTGMAGLRILKTIASAMRILRLKMMVAGLCGLAWVLPMCGQTAISPYRAVHPIMPDPNQRAAPSSATEADLGPSPSSSPAKARIESCLTASKLHVLGTIDGIKATLYVTNVSERAVTPQAKFMVCDTRGSKLATVAKLGDILAAGGSEKIEILATNLNAADLKLLQLSAAQNK